MRERQIAIISRSETFTADNSLKVYITMRYKVMMVLARGVVKPVF